MIQDCAGRPKPLSPTPPPRPRPPRPRSGPPSRRKKSGPSVWPSFQATPQNTSRKSAGRYIISCRTIWQGPTSQPLTRRRGMTPPSKSSLNSTKRPARPWPMPGKRPGVNLSGWHPTATASVRFTVATAVACPNNWRPPKWPSRLAARRQMNCWSSCPAPSPPPTTKPS